MVASVLALMSVTVLGDVYVSWQCPTVRKNFGIDVNQITWMFVVVGVGFDVHYPSCNGWDSHGCCNALVENHHSSRLIREAIKNIIMIFGSPRI